MLESLEDAHSKGSEAVVARNEFTGKIRVECLTDVEDWYLLGL